MRFAAAVVGAWLLTSSPTAAQEAQGTGEWEWAASANVFFGYNYQQREFRDFSEWESQNWFMAGGQRRTERDRARLQAMFSLEAFTIQDVGSPQVFQTGETFKNAPLIDYQHPHDLIMALGGDYQVMAGRVRLAFGADLVGSPTLGPAPFMHRASASENPQAPLAHHYLDSTHITHGVLRTGIGLGRFMLEGSWFRGQEPDEDRLDLDLGALDSGAVRISWLRGPWSAQLSGAYLTRPERVSPFDAKRVTASVARDVGIGSRGISWLAAFGQNREAHGNFEAYLFEATWRPSPPNAFYTRLESVAKDILDAGFHPTVFHRHRQSQVAAVTGGYARDLVQSVRGTLGVGGDITAYGVPANLKESYGAPLSFHVFLRFRGATGSKVGTHTHH